MSSNIANQVAYLRSSREFPEEAQALSVETSKAYIDTANAVNNRIISIFPTTRAAINGESWYLSKNKRQQGFRQVYSFVAADLPNIPHNLTISEISGFTRIWGTYVDAGGVWYPIPFVSATAAANQVQIQVNSTNIVARGS